MGASPTISGFRSGPDAALPAWRGAEASLPAPTSAARGGPDPAWRQTGAGESSPVAPRGDPARQPPVLILARRRMTPPSSGPAHRKSPRLRQRRLQTMITGRMRRSSGPAVPPSAAGRLLRRRSRVLGGMNDQPRRPFVAVMGGSRSATSLQSSRPCSITRRFMIVGGGICFTFLKAKGHNLSARHAGTA